MQYFFFFGHAGGRPDDPGGAIFFYNGTESYLIAENRGYIPVGDHYYLSSTTTELNDILLAVYEGCYTGKTSSYFGNLVDVSSQKGIDNSIGFGQKIYSPHAEYWSERFWYRCLYGQNGNHQTIKNAANGAVQDIMIKYGDHYGFLYMYTRYRPPYHDYLDPARYGVV